MPKRCTNMHRPHETAWFGASLNAFRYPRKRPVGAKNGKNEPSVIMSENNANRKISLGKLRRTAWRHTRQAYQAMTRAERKERRATYQLARQAWKTVRQTRQATLQQRQLENQAWHQANREIQTGSSDGHLSISFLDCHPGDHRQLYATVLGTAHLPYRFKSHQR